MPGLVSWGLRACRSYAPGEDGGDVVHSQYIPHIGEMEPAAKVKSHIVLAPPKGMPLHEMLAEAMLENSSAHQRRSALDWVVSFVVHVAILAVLMILPLYFTTGLDFQKLNLTFLAPPLMPAAPPPPPMASAAARPVRTPPRVFAPGKLTAPSFIPKAVVTASDSVETPPDDVAMGVPGGIPGGLSGGFVGGVLGGVLKGAPAPPVAERRKEPVRVGGDVKPPRLLSGPEPEYPVLARQARLSGVVVIEAIIDENGKVTGMRVISGHPLLIPSALNAVSKRKYEPTVLDGEPIPVDFRVEVSFHFS
jgi:protein TonB